MKHPHVTKARAAQILTAAAKIEMAQSEAAAREAFQSGEDLLAYRKNAHELKDLQSRIDDLLRDLM
jgi:hypothetical protein